MSNIKELTKGIIKENPVLVTLLGMCPTLAITTTAFNGLGMGLATAFVLIGSNIVISLLKIIITKTVHLPAFFLVIIFIFFLNYLIPKFYFLSFYVQFLENLAL